MKFSYLLRTLAALLLLAGLRVPAEAYNVESSFWARGSNVIMQVALVSPAGPLEDGFASFNASAADAAAIWNGYLDFISFSTISKLAVPEVSGDGVNSVFPSSTIFGDSFGQDTLAVTVLLADRSFSNVSNEADVIVNSADSLNSYIGPQQAGVYDLHRILLHEFGHVLGLDHVNNSPPGQAIMEPIISNLDHLGSDDIAGVRFFYGAGFPVLSPDIFLRQTDFYSGIVMANNDPMSYSALGLPPGLKLTRDGIISGRVTAGGVYTPVITAHGSITDAYGTFKITVQGLNEVPGLLNLLRIGAHSLTTDPIRSRVYSSGLAGIYKIDTETFETTNLLNGDFLDQVSLSADASDLLFVSGGTQLQRINLTTGQQLPALPLPSNSSLSLILEGLNHRDYGAGKTQVVQFDATTGALQTTFSSGTTRPTTAMSVDRATLFVTQAGTLSAYDISNSEPTLQTQVVGSYFDPVPSPDGQFLYAQTQAGNASLIARFRLPDLTPAGTFASTLAVPGVIALNPDGSIYRSYSLTRLPGGIELFDPVTLVKIGSYDFGGLNPTNDVDDPSFVSYQPGLGLVFDNSGKYLFASVLEGPHGLERVWVFSTDLSAFPPPPPVPTQNLANISTRAHVGVAQDAMIGGFIIQGTVPKKVLLRAIGPSLPLSGALSNPVIDLYDSTGKLVTTNNDWIANRLAILGTQLAPASDREAAILTALPPDSYTAVIRDLNDQPGLALVEVYDLDAQDSLLANISTRGKVETGDNVMIGGFIIGGKNPTKVLLRAIGPSLTKQGITGPLADPILELHDSTGKLIMTNDNWRATQPADIIATGIPPANDKESAIVTTLSPGNYTAIVRGQNDTTGVALVEVYNLGDPNDTSK